MERGTSVSGANIVFISKHSLKDAISRDSRVSAIYVLLAIFPDSKKCFGKKENNEHQSSCKYPMSPATLMKDWELVKKGEAHFKLQ